MTAAVNADAPRTGQGPQLADGVQLVGEYLDSGFAEPHYLIARADQQMLHVSQLVYLVARNIDGQCDIAQVARRVSDEYGRVLEPDGVEFLLTNRLGPMGLLKQPVETSGFVLADPPPTGTPDPADGPKVDGSSAVSSPRANPLLVPKLRRTLLPPRLTRFLARVAAPTFHPWVVALSLVTLIAADVLLIATIDLAATFASLHLDAPLVLFVFAMLLTSTLFHELGHAAATHYGGGRPGAIGVAVYIVYPAFYTDVTDSYRLDRTGRIRTDLGGVYFNVLSVLAMTAAYQVTGFSPLLLAIALTHLEAIQQLLPIVRLDGYFVLTDLVGVPDLFGRIGPILRSLLPGQPPHPKVAELRRRTRVVVSLWVFTTVPVMAILLGALVWTAPTLITSMLNSLSAEWAVLGNALVIRDVAQVVLAGLSLVLIPLPTLGLGYLVASGLARTALLLVRTVRKKILTIESR